jgi:mono/diheme cytochrome c family protein
MRLHTNSMSSRSARCWRRAGVLQPGIRALARIFVAIGLVALFPGSAPAADRTQEEFEQHVRPILEDHCYACHGNGSKKGGIVLDGFAVDQARLHDSDLWLAVLKNVRAGIMPPAGKPRPTDQESRLLEDWIKYEALGIDPKNPDPGRVTVRRLNRVEYRNTVRDLIGVDYDTSIEFPPDDTGHGFDNIGEVLTLSPLLLEKYVTAARAVVSAAVPTTSRTVAEQTIAGRRFRGPGAPAAGESDLVPLSLSYYRPAVVSTGVRAEVDGRYQLVVDLSANERFVDGVFDLNRCRLIVKVDGRERIAREYTRQDGRAYHDVIDLDWQAGDHQLALELQPLTPAEKQVRSLTIRVKSVTVRGPVEEKHWVRPKDYARFFPKDVPASPDDRREYARELLGQFATRAFRRPVDNETVEKLAAFAASVYTQSGQTFEAGIAHALTAILASPAFLFREEKALAGSSESFPLIDEYALASRLSYFLWSSMPDDELVRLAAANKLRDNLSAQVTRMLGDGRSEEFVRHFVGQWLQARDVDSVQINAFAVIAQDDTPDPEAEKRRARFRELARKPVEKLTDLETKELERLRGTFGNSFRRFREFELNGELRRAMRRETEMLFGHIVRNGSNVLELIDSDYTFLNERLAGCYGIAGVKGEEMRRVPLPPGGPRGGVLTQGTVLVVTSNPDRTSPVKRGLFILDNILGTPPAPPPADIPPLEDAARRAANKKPTLREALALHRQDPKCSSCHNRMDPLGLAFENFNALGRWRDKERGQKVDASGRLITGEEFKTIQELKHILVNQRQRDFYRCLSEKLLTYALGRGLGAQDVEVVDRLVERLESEKGNARELVMGVVDSVPFQRARRQDKARENEAVKVMRAKAGAISGSGGSR